MHLQFHSVHYLSIVCFAVPLSLWGCENHDATETSQSEETVTDGTLGAGDNRIMTIPARVYTPRPDEPFTLLVTVDAFRLEDGTGVAEQLIGRHVVGHVVDDNGQVWDDASAQSEFGAGTYADRPFIFGAVYEPMWYIAYLHRFCAESCDMQFRFAWGTLEEIEAAGELGDLNGPRWIHATYPYVEAERTRLHSVQLIDAEAQEYAASWGILRIDVDENTMQVGFESFEWTAIDPTLPPSDERTERDLENAPVSE
jgi:hypothetical protein